MKQQAIATSAARRDGTEAGTNPFGANQMGETRLSKALRAGEWWEFKLAPVFGTLYATAFLLQIPLLSLWSLLLLTFAALVPGAAYVSIINDFTDLAEDAAAGKANRLRGRPRGLVFGLLACCIAPGLVIGYYWRAEPLLLGIYGAAWMVFSLYSLPPFRWKHRGALGVLCDACGANLLPHLLVATMVFRWSDTPVSWLWLFAVGLWSLCYGLRGILWHQLMDLESDARSGARTLAQRVAPSQLRVLGKWILFPLEVASLCIFLWRAGNALAFGFLALHFLLEYGRVRLWKMNIVIVAPRSHYHIALQEYYEALCPLAFLITSALMHPLDALLIVAHGLLFPRRAMQAAKDAFKLLGAVSMRKAS
jgi:4-hydroxybenzoate polyprenyltransferase